MCKKKLILALFVLTTVIQNIHAAMSEAQLKAASKMIGNVCQPKTKASPEDIKKMHEGDWNIEKPAMCYMGCCLTMSKLIGKDNKFDLPSATLQMKQLPESRKAPTMECSEKCKDAAVTLDDKCVAAYEITKCIYFCNPVNYFLP